MLIDLVTEKTQELGLTCARLPVHQTDTLHHSRWLHIEGRPCQVVSARIFYPQQGRTKLTAYGLYLPTSRWPDFLIYVSKDKAQQGQLAATEFQKILDHRGLLWNCATGALARLGLGRGYALQGNTGKSRAAYQDFFTLWKDADPDIPILKEAKAEYAKLQ